MKLEMEKDKDVLCSQQNSLKTKRKTYNKHLES